LPAPSRPSGRSPCFPWSPPLAARKADISLAISTGHIMCYRHFAGRGLTGRGPRPYPLPASEWLVSYRRELYCRRAAGSFCEVLGQLARLPYCFHSHQNRPLSRSYSSEKIVRSLPQEQWFVPQSMTAQTPNKAQTHTGQQHTRRQRPRFRRYAQPSMDQHVYAKSALQRLPGTQ